MHHGRVYSYHYIYDFLFVQVTEEQYAREYAKRIRTFNAASSEDETPERTTVNSNGIAEPASPLNGLQVIDPSGESSPKNRLRGPALKLNQNQVFFSPNGKDPSSTLDADQPPRFRQSQTENMDASDFAMNSNPASIDTSDNYMPTRKQVVKVKKPNSMRAALDKALQSTQFEGLKILTRETILKASKYMDNKNNKGSDDENS